MKTGKISESVLKRSVLRQIENQVQEVKKGAGVGGDCAFLAWENPVPGPGEEMGVAASAQTIALPVKRAAYLAVMAAANNLAAAGAHPVAVTLSLTLPEETQEQHLREWVRQADECGRELGMQIAGGHTEVSAKVQVPVITATALGKGRMETQSPPESFQGLDIVMSKWIGMEGAFLIASEREQELLGRYPAGLLGGAREQGKYLSVAPEAAIAQKSGVYAMHDVRCGGIFGALWEVSQKLGVGLCVNLKKIPVRQETIEVCEFYNLNPYGLISGGALLMLTRQGEYLAEQLEGAGISAAVIGKTNGSNDKIVCNKDETRYLGPPVPDEIYKVFQA